MAWKLIDTEKLNESIAFVDKQHYKAGLTKEFGNHQIPMFMFDAAIPDCATNGDVLRKLFPDGKFWDKGYVYWFSFGSEYLEFSPNWWNALYTGGVKEQHVRRKDVYDGQRVM